MKSFSPSPWVSWLSVSWTLKCATSMRSSHVNVTTDVVYGSNVTVLPLLQARPAAQPLACDIYEPAGDTETDRPLIICTTRATSSQYERKCRATRAIRLRSSSARFAQMGYVVASINYRLGQTSRNPVRTDLPTINAAIAAFRTRGRLSVSSGCQKPPWATPTASSGEDWLLR